MSSRSISSRSLLRTVCRTAGIFSAALICALTMSSCEYSMGDLNTGELEIFVPSSPAVAYFHDDASRAVRPASDEIIVTHILVTGTKKTGKSATLTPRIFSLSEEMLIRGMKVGTWEIALAGLSKNDANAKVTNPLSKDVDITVGRKASAAFSLTYMMNGVGTFAATVEFPASVTTIEKVTGRLRSGNDSYSFDAVAPFGASADKNIAVVESSTGTSIGDFDFDLIFHNASGTEIAFDNIDTVNIYSGKHSVGTVTLPSDSFSYLSITSMTHEGTFKKDEAPTITISASETDADIYYTDNGATPTIQSTKYSGPFVVDTTKTIKAIAVGDGYVDSPVVSKTYAIDDGGFNIDLPGYIETVSIETADNQHFSIVVEGESGSGDKIYSWYLDGVLLEGETNDTLDLSDLAPKKTPYRLMARVQKGPDGRTFSSSNYTFKITE